MLDQNSVTLNFEDEGVKDVFLEWINHGMFIEAMKEYAEDNLDDCEREIEVLDTSIALLDKRFENVVYKID